jgi:hypothetical protein
MLETLHAFVFETTQSFHGRKRNTETKTWRKQTKTCGRNQDYTTAATKDI